MSIQGYVTYTRVSTKGQGESGLGLEAQEALLNHYLDDKDIVKQYTETASAKSVDDRPVLQEAIAYCLEHGHGLAVAKVDRLSRITEHALDVYTKLDGMLYSCDIPCTKFAAMDKFTLTIFMAIADRERELIGIRTKQALTERYKSESWQTSHKNNSFTQEARELAAKAKRDNAVNRDKQVFCLIEGWRNDGKSFGVIAKKLIEAGFKTARDKQHTSASVKRIYDRGIAAQVDC